MNRNILAAAALALSTLGAPAAFANEAGMHDFYATHHGSLTRDQVRADRIAAAARGRIDAGEAGRADFAAGASSTKTRAQVMAEFFEARRLGLLGLGEKNSRDATPEEVQLIAAAGQRALQMAANAR
jgi:predicted amidohydrolase